MYLPFSDNLHIYLFLQFIYLFHTLFSYFYILFTFFYTVFTYFADLLIFFKKNCPQNFWNLFLGWCTDGQKKLRRCQRSRAVVFDLSKWTECLIEKMTSLKLKLKTNRKRYFSRCQSCQIFSWYKIPKLEKYTKMITKYTKYTKWQ
jgi:hypothetical protein